MVTKDPEEEDDIEVLEGNIQMYISNGTPSIDFFDGIYQNLA